MLIEFEKLKNTKVMWMSQIEISYNDEISINL